MEWILLMVIVAVYCGLSSQIKNISKAMEKNKKDFPSLKSLLNRDIEIKLKDDFINIGTKGKLIKYDEEWLALLSNDKKGNAKLNYFRLNNIESINIFNK